MDLGDGQPERTARRSGGRSERPGRDGGGSSGLVFFTFASRSGQTPPLLVRTLRTANAALEGGQLGDLLQVGGGDDFFSSRRS